MRSWGLVPARGGHGRRSALGHPHPPLPRCCWHLGPVPTPPRSPSSASLAQFRAGLQLPGPQGPAAGSREARPGGRMAGGDTGACPARQPWGPSHVLQTSWPATCADLVLNPRPALLRPKCSGLEVSASSWSRSAALPGPTGLAPPGPGRQFVSPSLSVTGMPAHHGATPQPGKCPERVTRGPDAL